MGDAAGVFTLESTCSTRSQFPTTLWQSPDGNYWELFLRSFLVTSRGPPASRPLADPDADADAADANPTYPSFPESRESSSRCHRLGGLNRV